MSISRGDRRPSPEVIISVLAIVAAVAGTAIAGPLAGKSALSKKEKKQTKNIAAGVVKNLAPGLSVGKAANANTLDGVSEGALAVSRSQYSFDCNPNSLTFLDCVGVDLALPRAARVQVFASSGMYTKTNMTAPVEGECRVEVDDSTAQVPGLNAVGSGENTQNTLGPSGDTNGVMYTATTEVLAAGTHTLELSCNDEDPDIAFSDSTIVATIVGSG